jgi:hypothetical protein
MRNPLNRPMLAVLLAAGVISLLDSDDRPRAEVRFAPLVRNGHEVGLKVMRGKRPRLPASRAPSAPRPRPTISQRGSSALPS